MIALTNDFIITAQWSQKLFLEVAFELKFIVKRPQKYDKKSISLI